MITIRTLAAEELTPERVGEIDVSEDGTIVYKFEAGKLIETSETWRRTRWSAEKCIPLSAQWKAQHARGDSLIGAFDSGRLVGIGIIRYEIRQHLAQLEELFVSAAYRRRGVAAQLTAEIIRLARASGATQLYVSATPSVSAVGFYTSQGFQPTADVIPELFELEPEDIHMTRPV